MSISKDIQFLQKKKIWIHRPKETMVGSIRWTPWGSSQANTTRKESKYQQKSSLKSRQIF